MSSAVFAPPKQKTILKEFHSSLGALELLFNATELKNPWIFVGETLLPPAEKQDRQGIKHSQEQDSHYFIVDSTQVKSPLFFIHFIANESKELPPPKTIVTIQGNTPVTLIECYVHQLTFEASHSAVNEFILQDNAVLHHIQIQQGSSKSSQFLNSTIIQHTSSHYHGSVFASNLLQQKTTIDFLLQAPFATTTFQALMNLKLTQKASLILTADHKHPHCQSKMTVRGVVNDQAKGDFLGKIIVREGASQTQAHLENKNLLLSEQAEITTKPLLEVYNDNIQCSHGATVGHLDAQALFYLKSRGIPENEAKKMLVESFIKPILVDLPAFALPFCEELIREY